MYFMTTMPWHPRGAPRRPPRRAKMARPPDDMSDTPAASGLAIEIHAQPPTEGGGPSNKPGT
jgi:hypothetical protein